LRYLCVNLRILLCGVKYYASDQMLDFLDLAKNYWFPIQKLKRHRSGFFGWMLINFICKVHRLTIALDFDGDLSRFAQLLKDL